jgi:hypothetical protein
MLLSRLGSRETAIWHPRSFAKPRKTPQRAPDLTPHTHRPLYDLRKPLAAAPRRRVVHPALQECQTVRDKPRCATSRSRARASPSRRRARLQALKLCHFSASASARPVLQKAQP